MTTNRTFLKPQMQVPLPPIRVIVALFVVYLIWGSTYLGTAIVLGSYPPFLLTAIRQLLAIVIMFAALRLRGAALPAPRETANALFTGALMFSGAGMVALGQDLGVASGLTSLAVGCRADLGDGMIAFLHRLSTRDRSKILRAGDRDHRRCHPQYGKRHASAAARRLDIIDRSDVLGFGFGFEQSPDLATRIHGRTVSDDWWHGGVDRDQFFARRGVSICLHPC